MNSGGYAGGGEVSGQPIDVDAQSIIPGGQIPHIQAHIPQLNLNPPQQSQQGNSNGLGQGIGTALSLAKMFMGSGGAVHRNPFADGGDVGDDTSPATFDQRFPMQLAGPQAMDAWRNGTPDHAMAFAATPPGGRPAAAAPAAPDDAEEVRPTSKLTTVASPSIAPQGATASGPSLAGFLQSPWAAVTAGGLESMRTGSLAQGFADTMKLASGQREAGQKDETIAQAAQRLQNEVKFHQDELNKPPTGYDYATDNTMQAIPGGPADPAVVTALTKAKAGNGLLDSDARQFIAESYLAGDKSALSGLGYGNVGSQNRAAVMGDITRMAQERGITGSQLAAIKADYAASTAGARTSAVQSARIDSAVEEAQRTMPLALAASQAVQRGQWVPLNQLEQAAQKAGSNSALAKFSAANQSVITSYAAAMTRGANVIPVDARRHAEMLLSTAMSPEAYQAVISQLQLEMQAAKSAPEAVRQRIMDHISGRASAPAPAAPAGGAAPDRGAIEAEMRRRGLLP